jgi:hypothetical protein
MLRASTARQPRASTRRSACAGSSTQPPHSHLLPEAQRPLRPRQRRVARKVQQAQRGLAEQPLSRLEAEVALKASQQRLAALDQVLERCARWSRWWVAGAGRQGQQATLVRRQAVHRHIYTHTHTQTCHTRACTHTTHLLIVAAGLAQRVLLQAEQAAWRRRPDDARAAGGEARDGVAHTRPGCRRRAWAAGCAAGLAMEVRAQRRTRRTNAPTQSLRAWWLACL